MTICCYSTVEWWLSEQAMNGGIIHFLGMAPWPLLSWRLFHTITIKMLPIAAVSESLECK